MVAYLGRIPPGGEEGFVRPAGGTHPDLSHALMVAGVGFLDKRLPRLGGGPLRLAGQVKELVG